MSDVTCLGHLCADVIAKPVDAIPEKGKLNLIDQLEMHTGGCANNTSIDLAKIGVSVSIIGKIGRDGFGDFICKSLNNSGVNTEGLKQQNGLNTSASVVMVSKDGERTFLHCWGSNAELTEDDVDFEIIKKSKILFIGGSLLLPKFDGEPTADVLKKAQSAGVYTMLDTAWDSTGRWMKCIKPCLKYLDLFIPSIEEAEMISGKKTPEEMADLFMNLGVKNVVIKLGKDGCFIKNNSISCYVPTFNDVKKVDTTGAGDSFVAGFITGLLKKWDLKKCAVFANAVGSHCIMEMGASEGIKPYKDIIAFIKARNKDFCDN